MTGEHTHRARPWLTIRLRLTLVYGGLFLLAGVLLLGVTYALISQRLPANVQYAVAGLPEAEHTQTQDKPGAVTAGPSGTSLDWDDAVAGSPPPESGFAGRRQLVTQVTEGVWRDALNALLTQGGIALVLVGAAAIGFGWLIAGRMLAPLHQMTATARRIADAPAADHSLHQRIALDGPHDEIKELADTFDVMLERLDRAFDGQRRFIANASHELRTPLTLNRALLEVAVHRRAAGAEVRQLGETLLEINSRHERLIDGLLLLARSEAGVAERSFVDLADIVDHVVGQTPRDGVTVATEAGPAPTMGSPVLLERLAQNLVENAVRYNEPAGGWVRVTTGTRADGSVTLIVANPGPVVPPYEIPNLFEPFRRLGQERIAAGRAAPGAGLGLSIVRAVARAHGGDVRAEPREGGGLTVTVTLPGVPS